MGMLRRLVNIGVGLVAAVTAIALLKDHQKNSLYEAEFREVEEPQSPADNQ